MASIDSRSRAWVEVDLGAIRSNVAAIAAFFGRGASVMAVVKADAYGHGLLPVARDAIAAGAGWLGIATIGEGDLLREAKITTPIALLSAPAVADAAEIVRYGLTAMVGDAAILDALHAHASLCNSELTVHLDIDTGIGRSGVLPKDAVALWRHACSLGIRVEGISTHFANAGGVDDGHTRSQMLEFDQTLAALHASGACFEWTHIDNSASITACASEPKSLPGILSAGLPRVAQQLRRGITDQECSAQGRSRSLSEPKSLLDRSRFPAPSATCNLVRPGLLIYGIAPRSAVEAVIEVRPALALNARIATIRDLPINHAISYGVTHRLLRNSRVATVSIGYGDGYPRALSNRGYMLVRGRRAPILGTVCMDQTIVDVTEIADASPGDEVVCIGKQSGESITVEQIAASTGVTLHEITTGLTARLPRVYTGSVSWS